MTGRTDAEQLIAELERTNMFVVALDTSRRWYRYHQLFRGALARELEARDPIELADLHRRASEWYADQRRPGDAIEHALLAGDVHVAADELAHNWLSLYSDGQGYAILDWLDWLDRLPSDVVTSHPSLCLIASGTAWSLGRRDDAARFLGEFEARDHGPDEIPGVENTPAAAAAIIRAMLALTGGDIAGALSHARRAYALETDERGLGRTIAGHFLGVVLYYADDPDAAESTRAGFLTDPRTAGQYARAVTTLAYLAYIALDRGDVHGAHRLARQALERAVAHGVEEYPHSALAQGAMGASLLAQARIDDAEEHLEQAVALARRSWQGCDVALTMLHLGRLRLRQGDREAARDALTAARAALDRPGLPRISRLEAELSARLGRSRREHRAGRAADVLTEAELRVLRMLPRDLTHREIAERLFISMNTLKTHTQRIRRKLEVTSRSEAVAAARRRGLL